MSAASFSKLTPGIILRFFAPLALSWIFMAVESPINVSVLSRLPDAVLNTAAFSILMSLSLWIESPVIDLLSTSTTLTKDGASYRTITKFALALMGLASGVHAIVGLTPLYWLVIVKVLNFPLHVAEHARTGFIIMIPWSACIGWRRYLQGILIRFGQTRLIGFGTFVRVSTMGLISLVLFLYAPLPGVAIAGIALASGVFFEAAFIHLVSRSIIHRHLLVDDPELPPVTMAKLRKFHIPLTLTTMVNLSSPLLVGVAVAHAAHPVLGLASLQVAQSLLWLHRTAVFALPEVVITLVKDEDSASVMRRFCVGVGLVTSGLLTFCWLTGLDRLFFVRTLGATEGECSLAHLAFIAYALTPFIGALQSYIRGMLTIEHLTFARLVAMVAGVVSLGIGLVFGVMSGMVGVVAAGLAYTVSMLVELAFLVRYHRARQSTLVAAQ